MERAHRRYSPSQAERFSACPGSTALLARTPARPSSVYAEEGTNAHDILEHALRNDIRDAKKAHKDHPYLGLAEFDDGRNEFYFSIRVALDYVYGILDAHPDALMYVETFVDPPIKSAPGEAGGYCDIAIYIPSLHMLYVIDYKHGAGVAKAVKGNKQIKQYAAGFLYDHDTPVNPDNVSSVVAVIVQPRAFHEDGMIREDELTPYELWEYLEDLEDYIKASEAPDAPLIPGEDQCRFCDARTSCPAREAKALQVAGSHFEQIRDFASSQLTPANMMEIERLARVRFHAPALRKWLDDVDAHCEELARAGHHIPGAKLVAAQARRVYYGDDNYVARKLAAMLGERNAEEAMDAYEQLLERYPVLGKMFQQKLVTITSAEKMVTQAYKQRVARNRQKHAAEQAKQSFAFLTLKQSSGNVSLVDEDDKRPAVNKAQSAFAQIAGVVNP